MVTAVGIVMGLHAAYEIFIGGVEINLSIIPHISAYIGAVHSVDDNWVHRTKIY